MHTRLALMPWYVQGFVMAVVLATVASVALFASFDTENWLWIPIITAVGAALLGAGIGALNARETRRTLDGLHGVAEQDWPTVFAATIWRGPVPADPFLRRTALQLLEDQQLRARSNRTFIAWAYPLLIALFILVGTLGSGSPLHYVNAALFTVAWVRHVFLIPRAFARRRLLLTDSAPAPGPASRGVRLPIS